MKVSYLRSPILGAIWVVAASVVLTACGGDAIREAVGLGKSAPDEREVRTHDVLAMPPDLQLRPPSDDGQSDSGRPNVAADAARTAALNQPPRSGDNESGDAGRSVPTVNETAPVVLGESTEVASVTQEPETEQDVYARFGISRTHPDGRPKEDWELQRELREKRIERERARNPNYGTIWNLGNIFSD